MVYGGNAVVSDLKSNLQLICADIPAWSPSTALASTDCIFKPTAYWNCKRGTLAKLAAMRLVRQSCDVLDGNVPLGLRRYS